MTDDKYRDQLAEAIRAWEDGGGPLFAVLDRHLSPVVAQIRADAHAEVAAAIEAALDRPLGEYIVTAGEMAVRAALAPYRTQEQP